jgi:hypothetical protein
MLAKSEVQTNKQKMEQPAERCKTLRSVIPSRGSLNYDNYLT